MSENYGPGYGRQVILNQLRKGRDGIAASREALLVKQREGKKLTKKELQLIDALGQLLDVADNAPDSPTKE